MENQEIHGSLLILKTVIQGVQPVRHILEVKMNEEETCISSKQETKRRFIQ